MQNQVFVLDTNKQPQDLCHPAAARKLLRDGHAAVYRRFPFTIILKAAKPDVLPAPIQLKIDPGSKTTGIALVKNNRVVFAAELTHRGQVIRNALEKRRAIRRGRRARKTRYRQPRFNNRTRQKGWLAPSLKSRVDNIQAWFTKFLKISNVTAISMELVSFDTQLMQNAEISGVLYQQGELAGYEVREYLLEKFNRTCVYCGAKDTPLEIEHINPRSRGGSNRISNLTLACRPCNQKKDNMTAAEFGYPEVQTMAKRPLKDAAAVNATRWATWEMLTASGMPVEVSTGGRTKFNRITGGYPKSHWIDAACVGESGNSVILDPTLRALSIKAMGRGTRQMCRMDKYGFPRTSAKKAKRVHGFQTGDMVRAIVPTGKQAGTHNGRLVVRTKGSFRIGMIDGVHHQYCRLIQKCDGYNYTTL